MYESQLARVEDHLLHTRVSVAGARLAQIALGRFSGLRTVVAPLLRPKRLHVLLNEAQLLAPPLQTRKGPSSRGPFLFGTGGLICSVPTVPARGRFPCTVPQPRDRISYPSFPQKGSDPFCVPCLILLLRCSRHPAIAVRLKDESRLA